MLNTVMKRAALLCARGWWGTGGTTSLQSSLPGWMKNALRDFLGVDLSLITDHNCLAVNYEMDIVIAAYKFIFVFQLAGLALAPYASVGHTLVSQAMRCMA